MKLVSENRRDLPTDVGVQAARWALLQDSGMTKAQERAFTNWVAEDPEHIAAYEDALWAIAAVATHAAAPEMMELRKSALAARGPRRHRWSMLFSGALAASLVAGLVTITHNPGPEKIETNIGSEIAATGQPTEYRTEIGERTAITLSDGTVVTLDTDSQMRVAYTNRERAVYLLHGQAMFDVAHAKPQPFQVYARGQRITALGTVFNVRINGDQVRVAMVEGSVSVQPRATAVSDRRNVAAPPGVLTLTAGEALVAEPAHAMLVQPVDAREVGGWTAGMLTFNDVPLAEAVTEINRYTSRPIRIADLNTGKQRISGTFKSNDPVRFAQAITEILPVNASTSPDGAAIISKRGH